MEHLWDERPSCELCGASNTREVVSVAYRDPRIWSFIETFYRGRVPEMFQEGTYTVLECLDCGFFWQKSILAEAWSEKLYEEWIDADASLLKREAAAPGVYHGLARTMGLVRHVVGPGRKKVVDFGMGWGHWCCMANAYGLDAMGIECSAQRIAFAETRGVKSVRRLQDLAPESVFFINADQVFEHIPRPLDVLKEMKRVLAPGGVVHIAVPDGSFTHAYFSDPNWKATKSAWHPLEHINTFTPRTLHALGARAGLTFTSIVPVPFGHKLHGLIPSWAYAAVRKTQVYFVA